MNKHVIFLLLSMIVAASASAQIIEARSVQVKKTEGRKYYTPEFGFHGGFLGGSANVKVNDIKQNYSASGFYVGIIHNMRFKSGVGFAFGLDADRAKYSELNMTNLELRVPLLLTFCYPVASFRIYAFGGVSPSYGVSSEMYDNRHTYSRLDIGVPFGVAVAYGHFGIEAGYSIGLMQRYKGGDLSTSYNVDMKFNKLRVGAFVTF